MASSKDYLEFILDQLSPLDEITYRAMMREYILYYRGKIVGGIYDDRLLVKSTKASNALIPNPTLEPPYEGAKEMILVEDVDSTGDSSSFFRKSRNFLFSRSHRAWNFLLQ